MQLPSKIIKEFLLHGMHQGRKKSKYKIDLSRAEEKAVQFLHSFRHSCLTRNK